MMEIPEEKKCQKNPNGDYHDLPHPVPSDPEWWKLNEAEKMASQFCKWCGKAIW